MLPNLSKLNIVLRSGFRIPIIGLQGGLPKSIGALLGQGKLLFGDSGPSFSLPFSTLAEVHVLLRSSTVFATTSDSNLVNQRRNLSFVGTISRTLSVPSVSGPPFQVCDYHIDRLLSDSNQITLDSPIQKIPMAVCSSKAVLRDCRLDYSSLRKSYLSSSSNGASLSYSSNNTDSCRKLTMSLKNREPADGRLIYGYFFYDVTRSSSKSNPSEGLRDFHSSCTTYCSSGPAPNVTLDGPPREDQVASSAVSSDQNALGDRTLKLVSGSCYLPHPDKEETGGEDAHFICVDEQAIGVADGVGGWAELGIDAGQYARELMSNSVTAIKEEPKGSVDPARVLEKAHSSTRAQGSSTACIIALTDKGIHAINLGDSGFLVVRDGCTVFRSPVQQHEFNMTYQLESGTDGDLPSSGQIFTIPVVSGDVIIAGTDGLFDNLYVNEVTAVVVHAVRAGLGPQVTAQKIAALARHRAQDTNRQTPFSTAAQDAGILYYGGKLDDITVIVSYISSSSSA